jgi:NADH-ubiquinone oxidoreductase chain 5
MYISIILLPLLGAIFSGFFGFFLGRTGSSVVSTFLVFCSFILSCFAFYEVGLLGHVHHFSMFPWMKSGYLSIEWGFLFDAVTVVMLIVVTSVSTLVHLYATNYMGDDPHLSRFMSYLSFFTFFMLILVTGDNFMQLFTGWEGVGVCSYLLINFWYTRFQANKSAIKAMVVNRVGDFGLALGIALIMYSFGTLSYTAVFASSSLAYELSYVYEFAGISMSRLDIIGCLLFIGSMGKSAQLGLHTWLPDAMEGPTPVSALIHAATMVTAGVFLIVRCSPIFEYMANGALIFIVIIGALTAFFAASTGLVQNDLKRIIAYSTCSQLGYMIFSCGLSNYSAAMFHLTNHAFFKALLFLGAGAVIHSIVDEQDIRKMGGLLRSTPFVYTVMLLGSLALMGFPYLSGFYSKDVILETSFALIYVDASFSYVLGVMAAFCTAFYSFRLVYYTFLGKPSGFKSVYAHFHETSTVMIVVFVVLAFGSVFSGFLLRDLFIGAGTDFWGNAILLPYGDTVVYYAELVDDKVVKTREFAAVPSRMVLLEYEYIPVFVKLVPLICGFLGSSLAVISLYLSVYLFKTGKSSIIYQIGFVPNTLARSITNFLGEKWYFDKIYTNFISYKFLDYGYYVALHTLDRGVIEIVGPKGIGYYVPQYVSFFNKQNDGHINTYVVSIIIGLILSLFVIVASSIIIANFPIDFVVFGIGALFMFLQFIEKTSTSNK